FPVEGGARGRPGRVFRRGERISTLRLGARPRPGTVALAPRVRPLGGQPATLCIGADDRAAAASPAGGTIDPTREGGPCVNRGRFPMTALPSRSACAPTTAPTTLALASKASP